jgi:heme/copper-type cytochrome/quinol oxidase subunit 3
MMTPASGSRIANLSRAAVPLALIGLAATTLLVLPPAHYSFYPQCPIYNTLHLLCPGCGTTRALAALLRGHVKEALRLNALTTLLLPILIVYAISSYRRLLNHQEITWPRLPSGVLYAVATIAVIFTIVRNLWL